MIYAYFTEKMEYVTISFNYEEVCINNYLVSLHFLI